MLTFNLRRVDGTTEPAQGHALVPRVDIGRPRLVLHRTGAGNWALSDPVSGIRVLTVMGSYRGIWVHSTSMGLPEARQEAQKQLQALCEAHGLATVRAKLDGAISSEAAAPTRGSAPSAQGSAA